MICHSTLLPSQGKFFIDKAAKELFPGHKPIEALPFSRSDFFKEGPKYVKGMSISGVQQKLSLKINDEGSFQMVVRDGEYILKPSPEAFPHAAENEQCAMAVSRMLGIPTAFSAIVPFANGEFAYITKRYDRERGLKLAQEDLAQGFDLLKKDKYSKSYEEALQLSHAMSGGKLSVVRDLFIRIIFAYVIGNDDMHLKNMSLIKKRSNPSIYYDSLTPNYDQLFSSSFENRSIIGFLALDLLKEENDGIYSAAYEKYGFYTSSDFKILGKRVGLPDKAVSSVVDHFINGEKDILDMINISFMPMDMKLKASEVVRDRIRALRL